MANTSFSQTLSQQQKLAPQMQQSLQFLQAPTQELQTLIQQELVQNEFEPSRWNEPVIGSRWVPEESLDRAADWATSQSSRWARPALGTAWWPRDGFPDIDAGSGSD